MMRTRCPNCATVFRITAEQLRVRFGMVRCGQCQAVFNAFDSLIEGSTASEKQATAVLVSQVATPAPENQTETTPPSELPELSSQTRLDPIDVALAAEETSEQSTKAARDAGMMAVRDLSETPGYDRWSAGSVDNDINTEFFELPSRRPIWPAMLALLLLALLLAGQLAYHYRSELVSRYPDLTNTYRAFNIDIPLPRQVEFVAIEVSDLQSDTARGLLILQATLRNRAYFAQAWPVLELTLTDTNDEVVSRRILNASDYLPTKTDKRAFAGSSEVGVKIWLESKHPAAGYRLFLFYP